MTTPDTIGRVARPRGVLTNEELGEVDYWRDRRDVATKCYREVVVAALVRGASFSEVSKATGLSKDTLQRWKREAGK